MAECDRCDVYFDFDPEEIYVLESDNRLADAIGTGDETRRHWPTEEPGLARKLTHRFDFQHMIETSAPALSSRIASYQGPTNLITITRSKARTLRSVFRRATLGIRHRSSIPPLVLHAEGTRLRAQYQYDSLAVEYVEPGSYRPLDSIPVPLDVLGDIEGRDDSPVVFEAAEPDRTVIRWQDHGIPQVRESPVTPFGNIAPFPETPTAWTQAPADLLAALAEASEICTDRIDTVCPELHAAPGHRSQDHRDRRPSAACQVRLRLPLGRRPADQGFADLLLQGPRPRPARSDRQDGHAPGAPDRSLDDLERDPEGRPLSRSRGSDSRCGCRDDPAATGSRGRPVPARGPRSSPRKRGVEQPGHARHERQGGDPGQRFGSVADHRAGPRPLELCRPGRSASTPTETS